MSSTNPNRVPTGVRVRHRAGCLAPSGETCSCRPAFEAGVYSKKDRRKVRRGFNSLPEAKRWLNEQKKARDDGRLRAPATISLADAAARWHALAEAGGVLTRSGDPYKPSVIRSYKASLDLHVLPHLGDERLAEISRGQVQRLVALWQSQGMGASTIGNAIHAVRAIYAASDLLTSGAVPVNPTRDVRLPARRGKRERIATVEEAIRLIEALPDHDRATWGLAFWAGLRHGEIKALRWEHVDLAEGTITVCDNWDQYHGRVDPKSRAGHRTIPIVGRLRDLLTEHRVLTGRASGLVCGKTAEKPFCSTTVNHRACRIWNAAGLTTIGLHEARHTAASFWIAAGLNMKTTSVYMGHASVAFTLDRYGHLLPGNEAESVERIDAYLSRSDTSARLSMLDG